MKPRMHVFAGRSRASSRPLGRRIVTAIAGAAAITIALAGCAGGSSAASGGDTKGPGPGHYKMDLGGYSGPAPTKATTTIKIMRQSWSDSANGVFDKTVKAFEKAYPNITVKEQLVPYGNLSTTLQTDVASGNVPDIVMGRSDFVSAYNYGQIAAPVGDYFTSAFKKDYTPALRKSVTVDGSMYALPWENQLQLLQYNADIFKAAGVATPPETTNPDDGWTVDQWFSAFAKLRAWMDANGKSKDYPLAPSGFGNGGPGSNYAQLESTWIRMQGSPDAPKGSDEYKAFTGVSANGQSVDGYIDNPLAIKGMENYQELFTKKWSPTDYVPNMWDAGTAAVDVGGLSTQPVKFTWGLTPMPKVKTVVSNNSSDSFIVSATSKNVSTSAALLGALTSHKVQLAWHLAWGSFPAQQSVIKSLPASETSTTKFKLIAATAATSYGSPKTPGWFEYFNQMNTTVRNIGLGADPKKSLDAAVTSIDKSLAKYKK